MTKSHDASSRRLHFWVWVPVLASVLGFVTWDAITRSRHALLVTGSYGVTVDAPPLDPGSPTGYANGRRSLILPDRSMDGYHWIMQAQTMVAQGGWRVRHVDYDHAPGGREVHWAGPYRWYLVFLAWIDRLWSGQPWGVAIERAALASGPVLLGVLLVGITPMLARRFAPAAAALFAFGAVAALPFYVDFVAGYADHHGLVNACGMLSVLFLLAADGNAGEWANGGPGRTGESGRARRWVIASAVAAGGGLWISAATQVSVLIGIGLGGVALCWLGRRPAGQANVWTRHPGLFRIWGVTGAGVSIMAYLIEYFPGHLGMRLEVNHPLYALAWLGGGEALCRLARIMGGDPPARRQDLVAAVIAAAAVVALPVVVLLTRQDNFLVADPFLWRLHNGFISEFESMPNYLARHGYGWESIGQCLPLLLLAPALLLGTQRQRSPEARSALALAVLPALFVLPLAWSQVRWWSLEYALLVPVQAAVFRTLRREGTGPRWRVGALAAGCALLFVPGAISAVRQVIGSTEMIEDDIRALAERDVGHWLRQRAGAGRVVVAGSPTITTSLVFYGGLTGVGTLYWENAGGLKDAAALYAAPTDEAARAVVRRCGITHIVVVSWDGFEGVYTRLARGLEVTAPIPPDAFIVRLLTAAVPPAWLRLIPFRLPRHPALDGQQVRIYEVTADQPPAEALVQAAGYYLEMGLGDTAGRLAPALAAQGENLAACATLAEIESRRGDSQAFSAALAQVVALLPGAKALPLDERVRVAAVLATARRFDLAGAELQLCLGQATEENLRQLSAGTLATLLALTSAAGIPWPDPARQQLASSLLPPNMRK